MTGPVSGVGGVGTAITTETDVKANMAKMLDPATASADDPIVVVNLNKAKTALSVIGHHDLSDVTDDDVRAMFTKLAVEKGWKSAQWVGSNQCLMNAFPESARALASATAKAGGRSSSGCDRHTAPPSMMDK